MAWFKTTRFDPELVSWQFDVFEWLFTNFGGFERFKRQALVTPTADFFPFNPTDDHSYATVVFETVKDYMGMDDWFCSLFPLDDENPLDKLRAGSQFYGSWSSAKSAAGLFELDRHGARIYYARSTLEDSVNLVATLSHELSHYLIASTVTDPPGGWNQLEPMTDLTSVFRGFGIFLANSAFTTKQWGDHTGSGWSASQQGYLSESELAFGLAIYCSLLELEPRQVGKYLRPNPRSDFKKAMKEMRHYSHRLQDVREVVPIPERE